MLLTDAAELAHILNSICLCTGSIVMDSYSTLCLKKNYTDVAHYNFNAHQLILVIFGRYVAEKACYRMVICYPTSHN